jgi:hypothetical protein
MMMQKYFHRCFSSWKSCYNGCINAEGENFEEEEQDEGKYKFLYVVKLIQTNIANFQVALSR